MSHAKDFIHHFHDCKVDLICLKCNAVVDSAPSLAQLNNSKKDHACWQKQKTADDSSQRQAK